MPFNILTIPEFDKNIKKLAKHYKNIKVDLSSLVLELQNNPKLGTHLFQNCYKIRVANSSRFNRDFLIFFVPYLAKVKNTPVLTVKTIYFSAYQARP
ncbi:MAG: hypothetical protein Q8N78_06670 [Sulfurimonas sp.]|nr:hypothetical protein [Sulfurimonas sp.]